MSNFVIKVEGLSKIYQLGEIGTGTISQDFERWWARLRGKEDPLLKIGETNDRNSKGINNVVWSLKDLSFEIERGDAVGIIGRNGSGKSTLLKILSRVTSPTTGKIKGKGRVASLLEVGTGFHHELTGRENIYLNGAILGMRKKEITRHFDAIVDFAGVERYIDTPVKRYSSGMYVRLAFAVAAHLESEILIVDEVLAVGDAEFQKKCLGKMSNISKNEGRTVLFVSHNMGNIQTLCNIGFVLNKGELTYFGEASNAINSYVTNDDHHKEGVLEDAVRQGGSQNVRFSKVTFEDVDGQQVSTLMSGKKYFIKMDLEKTIPDKINGLEIYMVFDDSYETRLFVLSNHLTKQPINNIHAKKFNITIELPKLTLKQGSYTYSLYMTTNQQISDWIIKAGTIHVENGDFFEVGYISNNIQGYFLVDHKFHLNANHITSLKNK